VLLALALFIGAGLFLAYREVPAPLQGQIDARTINVAPKITARITEHHVREGDAVTPGMVLVTLDSPEVRAKVLQAEAARTAADAQRDLVREGAREEEIRAAKAQWDKARTGAELAERTFRRIDALYQEGLLPLQRKDEAEANFRSAQDSAAAARAQYDTALAGARAQEKAAAAARVEQAAGSVAEINALAADQVLEAPLAAEVDKVVLHPGELAPAGFPILTLVDLNDIWAVFNVREDQFEGIAIGAELTGTVPALGGRTVRFKVFYISPKGDYATWRATRQSSGYDIRTFEVRARPAEAVEGLRPGMSVLVER
jgi:HlyD family secretion protein